MVIRSLCLLILFLGNLVLLAQDLQLDTVIQLDEVLVKEPKPLHRIIGQQTIEFNRLKKLLPQQTIAEVLHQSGAAFIKDYGPGRLSTISIQGGSASHASFIWNGIPIQQSQLGQLDLALLPLRFFDNIALARGGNAARWGSGSVSGTILANQKLRLRPHQQIGLQLGIGSFGQQSYALSATLSENNWGHSSRLFYEYATNDYPYEGITGQDQRLSNGALSQVGVLEEFQFKLDTNQQLGIHIWYQQVHRAIPPTLVQPQSIAQQDDEVLRLLFDWEAKQEKVKWNGKLAWLQDQLFFTDSLTNTYSDNRFQTLFSELSSTSQWFPRHFFTIGLTNQYTFGRSNNYDFEPSRNQLGLWATYRYEDVLPGWNIGGNSRLELIDDRWAPLTFRLGMDGRLTSTIRMNASIARNYRIPTFNDWYWEPGGNPDLLPEQSFEQVLGIQFHPHFKSIVFKYQLEGFNRQVDNWIIWLPQGSFWSPQNVQQVRSYGLTQSVAIDLPLDPDWTLNGQGQYLWTRSINQKTSSPNDQSLDKQLIYVPVHQGQLLAGVTYQSWQFTHWWTFTGAVYTTSDNSSTLPAYALGNFSLQKRINWDRHQVQASFRWQNITNKNYQAVLNYPMPRSNWVIQLQWRLQKTNHVK